MGYGGRALLLLKQYYEMQLPNINEDVVQEPIAEIRNVPNEAVNLLEETIGTSYYYFFIFSLYIISVFYIDLYIGIITYYYLFCE